MQQFGLRQINYVQVTSIDRFSEIISVWIRNEIFRLGFFGSIIKLTHMRRHHKIQALATDICAAAWQTVKSNIGQRCFIDVSLQHPSADGPFRWALLRQRFLNNFTNRQSNPQSKKAAHFLFVTRYLKEFEVTWWVMLSVLKFLVFVLFCLLFNYCFNG